MDRSKEYVKMCEKAVEIQEREWNKKEDLIVVLTYSWQNKDENTRIRVQDEDYYYSGVYFGVEHTSSFMTDKTKTKTVWLPRQDQLQEMIKLTDYGLNDCIKILDDGSYAIGSYDDEGCFEEYVDGSTMEQLWLAFVMLKKYNKVWNGKDWVEEE